MKEIELIQMIFKMNFSPLTCNVFYVTGWDMFYVTINETANMTYNTNTFEQELLFVVDEKAIKFPKNSFYDPFDNFTPHISEKLKIQTRRFFPSHYNSENGRLEIVEEKRNGPFGVITTNPRDIITYSGVTHLDLVRYQG